MSIARTTPVFLNTTRARIAVLRSRYGALISVRTGFEPQASYSPADRKRSRAGRSNVFVVFQRLRRILCLRQVTTSYDR